MRFCLLGIHTVLQRIILSMFVQPGTRFVAVMLIRVVGRYQIYVSAISFY